MKRHDLRSGSERRVRAAWMEGPGPLLRLAASLFGLASDLRHLAYESGFASSRRAEIPVLSVGGLTVGGSGKTPVAAAAAAGLLSRGIRPGVVSRGFSDELAVHRRLNPGALVMGAPDRLRAVEGAAERGAEIAILDDGFQHRRLARDLDWVVVSTEDARRCRWRRLPAGPARDRWGELARSDAVILTHRDGRMQPPPAGWLDRLRYQFPATAVVGCRFRWAGLRPANEAAAETGDPSPRVAFASVMRGGEFLTRLRETHPNLDREYLFPDHHSIDDGTLEEMTRAAGRAGILGTLKDAVKIADRLDPAIPLWYVAEEAVWSDEAGELASQLDVLSVLAVGRGRGGDGS